MKIALFVVLLLGAGVLLLAVIRHNDGEDTVNYRLVTVEEGDVEAVVSATGTLDAVTTVQVGTQVSGIIAEICVDFNDPVRQGQVIARIDTALLAMSVAGAEASLAGRRAELLQAQREYTRVTALHDEDMVSDSEFNAVQYGLEAAAASAQSAEVDLARAKQTLNYATITSPIEGTVISRSIDVGQTVQASFSAPELFLIAGDLKNMQILVAVDESDIGQIAEGQTARFTVQAYPDESFTGTVRQVRLQSVSEENVVNYTAVVDVPNPEGTLLPGMTATVDFLVETATNVLYVANASLRYRPDSETVAAAMHRNRSERSAQSDGGLAPSLSSRRGSGGAAATNRGMLWTLDENGDPALIPVHTGISDGTSTVVSGKALTAGQQVIAGVASTSAAANNNRSPFQQQSSGDRRPGPPAPGGI